MPVRRRLRRCCRPWGHPRSHPRWRLRRRRWRVPRCPRPRQIGERRGGTEPPRGGDARAGAGARARARAETLRPDRRSKRERGDDRYATQEMLHDFDPPLQFCVNEARAVLFRLPYSGLLLIATAGMNCHRALGVPHGRSGLARTARLEPAVQAKPHGGGAPVAKLVNAAAFQAASCNGGGFKSRQGHHLRSCVSIEPEYVSQSLSLTLRCQARPTFAAQTLDGCPAGSVA